MYEASTRIRAHGYRVAQEFRGATDNCLSRMRSRQGRQARLISHVPQYIPLCVVRDTGPATSVAGLSLHGTIPKWDAATLQRAQSGRKTACQRSPVARTEPLTT